MKLVQVLDCDVMLAKSPTMHIGDFRRLRAVPCDALQLLENVVVFPADGPRPHSNETAGV